METGDWLKWAEASLTKAGIGTARLDALVLLEDVLETERSRLLAHPEMKIEQKNIEALAKMVAMRATHVPLSYIRGKTEFYGREFLLDKDVLEPRPESETMVELFKKLDLQAGARVVDVGTGSGAIGITAQLERTGLVADLLDIDEKCLQAARANAAKHGLALNIYQSDLLSASKADYAAVLANLPYVPDSYHINDAAQHEPRLAIFGGGDGLDLYRRLFGQIKESGSPPKYVLTEALPFQHPELNKIAAGSGYRQQVEDDFIQLFGRA